MRIKVARFTDKNPAPIIIDPLLSTEAAMRERGRNELDSNQFSKSINSFSLPLINDINPGQLVEIQDVELGETWRGKVLSVSIASAKVKKTQVITVERPLI